MGNDQVRPNRFSSMVREAKEDADRKLNKFLSDQGLIDDRDLLDIQKIYWDNDGNLRYGVSERNRDIEVLDMLSRDVNDETEEARVWMIIPSRWVRNWLLFAHMKISDEPPGSIDMGSLLTRDANVQGGWRPRRTLRPPGKGAATSEKPVAPKKQSPDASKDKDKDKDGKKKSSAPCCDCHCGGGATPPSSKNSKPSCWSSCLPAVCRPSKPPPVAENQMPEDDKRRARPSLGPAAANALQNAAAQGAQARSNKVSGEDEDDFPGHYRRISVQAWLMLVDLYGVTEPKVAIAVRGTPYHDLRRWRVFNDPIMIDPSILPEGDGNHFRKPGDPEDDKYVPGKYLKKAAGGIVGALGSLFGGSKDKNKDKDKSAANPASVTAPAVVIAPSQSTATS